MSEVDPSFARTLLVRQAMPDDAAFIIHSWLASFREGDMVEGVPNQVYYHVHHKIVESIMQRATMTVLSDPQAPEVIYAWICWEAVDNGIIIHYCYVKNDFRNNRLGTTLLNAVLESERPPVVFATHRVRPMGFEFRKRKWIYNPYLLAKDMPQ